MAKKESQPGLDGRHRDENGEIRRKNGNTTVGRLRGTYGEGFAAGHRSDKKLENLLAEEGADSLSEYLKNSRR
jgi:hypothetical protein